MAFWLYCYYEMLELITKPQHLLVEKRGRHPEVEWCSFFEVQTLAELEAALCLSEKRSYDLRLVFYGRMWSLGGGFFNMFQDTFWDF